MKTAEEFALEQVVDSAHAEGYALACRDLASKVRGMLASSVAVGSYSKGQRVAFRRVLTMISAREGGK